MPILRITARSDTAVLHDRDRSLTDALAHALAQDTGPVTVMIHGYKYDPDDDKHCPHRSLLAPHPSLRGPTIISWPRRLGLRGQHGAGLGISFGWPARGSLRAAFARAETAGIALATLVQQIRSLAPDRPITCVAHSLGVRVALGALAHGAPLSRAVLLCGAEFHSTAHKALISPAGQTCQVLNVTSRENDLYDFLLERVIPAPQKADQILCGDRLGLPTVATLQLDDPTSLNGLKRLGYPVGGAQRRICHWSPYLRPGVFALYRAFLRGQLDVPALRAVLPAQTAPRWSRLRPALPAFGRPFVALHR